MPGSGKGKLSDWSFRVLEFSSSSPFVQLCLVSVSSRCAFDSHASSLFARGVMTRAIKDVVRVYVVASA